jgi:hypothetical protein
VNLSIIRPWKCNAELEILNLGGKERASPLWHGANSFGKLDYRGFQKNWHDTKTDISSWHSAIWTPNLVWHGTMPNMMPVRLEPASPKPYQSFRKNWHDTKIGHICVAWCHLVAKP